MFGLFKKKASKQSQELIWEDYKGYRIAATPQAEGSQYRVAGVIERGEGETAKRTSFTRADLIPSLEEAEQFCLLKARLMIDQLGEELFER